MAAVDIYVNETTRHADVILPPTTILERDHYDIVFHGLAVRNTARFTPAVFDKPRGARHDWEIFRDLTLRITARLDRKPLPTRPAAAAAAADAQPHVRRSGRCCAVAGRRPLASCGATPRASTSDRCGRPSPTGCAPRPGGSTWRRR